MQVLSIGEILWDVFPDREFLGGAALNFCVNTKRLGDSAALITAVGNDARGRAAVEQMKSLDLSTYFVQVTDDLPTGVATVTTTPTGEHFEIPRPAAFDRAATSPQILDAALYLRPDWLYFGTLLQMEPRIEQATRALLQRLPGTRGFYDMNLRPGNWNPPLVERLCRLASVLKLNESEAKTLAPPGEFSLPAFCERWSAQYDLDAICVTRGAAGCFIYEEGSICEAPGYPVPTQETGQDTVGAGDAFAAAFLHGYHRNWPMARTARFANALGSIVASRPGAIPAWSVEEPLALAASAPVHQPC